MRQRTLGPMGLMLAALLILVGVGPAHVPARLGGAQDGVGSPVSDASGIDVGSTVVVNDDVKLRAAPSPDAPVVADLPRGTELSVLAAAQQGGGFTWWPVQEPATGTIGYVRAEFLTPKRAAPPAVTALASPAGSGTPTGSPTTGLGEDDVKQRTLEALERSGTYRFQQFDVLNDRALIGIGEVNLSQPARTYVVADGSDVYFCVKTTSYTRSGSEWSVFESSDPCGDALISSVRQFRDAVMGWQLQGTERVDDRDAYVLRMFAQARSGAASEDTVWIDAATFLPIKLVHRALAPSGEVSGHQETVYSDHGASIDIQVPSEALQPAPISTLAPTPTPQLGPSSTDTPRQVAEGFLHAVIAGDLTQARLYFPPDGQPRSWDDVFRSDSRGSGGAGTDLSGCANVGYSVVERAMVFNGVQYTDISFIFDTSCVLSMFKSVDFKNRTTGSILAVRTESSTGRWFVQYAIAGLG